MCVDSQIDPSLPCGGLDPESYRAHHYWGLVIFVAFLVILIKGLWKVLLITAKPNSPWLQLKSSFLMEAAALFP